MLLDRKKHLTGDIGSEGPNQSRNQVAQASVSTAQSVETSVSTTERAEDKLATTKHDFNSKFRSRIDLGVLGILDEVEGQAQSKGGAALDAVLSKPEQLADSAIAAVLTEVALMGALPGHKRATFRAEFERRMAAQLWKVVDALPNKTEEDREFIDHVLSKGDTFATSLSSTFDSRVYNLRKWWDGIREKQRTAKTAADSAQSAPAPQTAETVATASSAT